MAGLWRLLGFDATLPPQVAGSRQQPATAGLTLRQLVYIILVEGLGALVIAGGANFGIAYAMYHHSNKPVKLWNINDNTLARLAAVVPSLWFKSCMTTRLCAGWGCRRHMHSGDDSHLGRCHSNGGYCWQPACAAS